MVARTLRASIWRKWFVITTAKNQMEFSFSAKNKDGNSLPNERVLL